MSLISVIENKKHQDGTSVPIIVGDLLISTNYRRPNIQLPTFPDGVKKHLDPHIPYLPIGLSQKTYIIKNDIAIALAGNVAEMILILEKTRDYFKEKKSSVEHIWDLAYNHIQPLNLQNSLFAIVLREWDPTNSLKQLFQIFTFSIGKGKWEVKHIKNRGEVKAAGSGASTFLTILEKISTEQNSTRQDNEHEVAAIALETQTLIGRLIQYELKTLKTISEYWGVNYEFIIFDVDKFIKIDEITVLVVQAYVNLEDKKIVFELTNLYHSKYYKDFLLINAIDYRRKFYSKTVVPPIGIEETDIDVESLPKEFTLYTTQFSLSMSIELSNGKRSEHFISAYSKPPYRSGKPTVELKIDSQLNYNLLLSEEILQAIINNIEAGR